MRVHRRQGMALVLPALTVLSVLVIALIDDRSAPPLSQALVEQRFVGTGRSVAALERSDSTALRIDPPLSHDDAIRLADALVIGTVDDQVLESGLEYEFSVRVTKLVSLIDPLDGGDPVRVGQPVAINTHEGRYYLVYGGGTRPLEQGTTYALLVTTSPDATFDVIRGHIYIVAADGRLHATGRPELDGSLLDELIDRYERVKDP